MSRKAWLSLTLGLTVTSVMCLSVAHVAVAHAAPQAAARHAFPARTQSLSPTRIIKSSRHDESPPLRSMRLSQSPLMEQIIQNRNPSKARMRQLRQKLVESGLLKALVTQSVAPSARPEREAPYVGARDSELQRRAGQAAAGGFTQPLLNFDGIGFADFPPLHSPLSVPPPYTGIAVGLHDVMEVTNYVMAAYDKNDGSLVFGPIKFDDIWKGFSSDCYTVNATHGPTAVMYDQWAQRWVVLELGGGLGSSNELCMAVSATSNPGGRWYRYEFTGLVPGRFDSIDSPKMGIWPNSYLVSFNVSGFPKSVDFVALDRSVMLQGGRTGTLLVWNVAQSSGAYSDLPVTIEGFRQPPAGSPALFANYVSPNVPNVLGSKFPYALALWEVSNLDWSAPGKAQLSLGGTITLPSFNDSLCNNQSKCIPERSPGQKLTAVSDRLMYPLAYRNLGDHEALVVNQTVTANKDGTPPAGIRWYEFDTSKPGANDWKLNQSGTYDPTDGKSRWMGSIGMDASGDMALGYSLSGPDMNPSIAYTGRKAGDPAGKMTAPETLLKKGGGVVLTGNDAPWGPFSSMKVDPVNGCTFWYANEYLPASGHERWNTRIGAFRFPGCRTAVQLGSLHGTVTDASTAQTVSGAQVVLAPNYITDFSDTDGQYRYTLPPGQYTERVFDFGYKPVSAKIDVTSGGDVEQDFSLVPAPTATLSGQITDKAHGYGLYAEITVVAEGIGQVATVWTDPATGKYSVALPTGFDYSLDIKAYWDGYASLGTSLTLKGDTTQNFTLSVGATCSAPGYAVSGFSEDFNGGFPPKGWSVVNHYPDSPVVWKSNTAWGDPNWTGGSGQSADMNSSAAATETGYKGPFAADLITPPIAATALSADPVLEFKASFAKFGSTPSVVDLFYLYIKSDKDSSWQGVRDYDTSLGTPFALPGATEHINLKPYITAGASTFQLLWRYQFPQGGRDVWYAQVDDVVIGACKPVTGGLVFGQISDANTGAGLSDASVIVEQGKAVKTIVNPQDARLKPGTYETFSSAGQHRFTATAPKYSPDTASVDVKKDAVLKQNLQLGAGKFSADKRSIAINVPVDGTRNVALRVNNAGTVAAHYHLVTLNVPASGSGQQPATAAPSASTTAPGSVVSVFPSGLKFLGGLGVDRDQGELWLGNPHSSTGNSNGVVVIPGENHDIRYRFDGTRTGDRINVRTTGSLTTYDMAYDDVTGMFWQIGADFFPGFNPSTNVDYSHIYELDPKTLMPTGLKIAVPSAQVELGLAFDPVSNTFYAGGPDADAIYHFTVSGKLLDATPIGVPIDALTYNPGTGHLFVLAATSEPMFYVLDAKHGYAVADSFDAPSYGVGLDHDCAGHLWVTDSVNKKVFEVVSGEKNWCAVEHIPWLTLSPPAATLDRGAARTVTLHFDGTGQKPYTTSRAQLRLAGRTPYPVQTIPLTVHWEAQPAALALSGSGAPSSVHKGDNVVYTLTVKNGREADHGAATKTQLTYTLPAGASYVSSSGDEGVVCGAPSAGTVTCQLGTLSPGSSKAVTIAVQANAAGTLSSEFTVSAREPNDGKSTLKLRTTVIGDADIVASGADATLTQGSTGQAHLAVSNGGPDAATDVVLNISTDASIVKLQSAASNQGSCAPASNAGYECDLGEIAAGGKVAVTLKIFGTSVGQATLTAHAKTSANDPDIDNDTTTATVTVDAPSPTTPANNGGGGGGFGWLGLATLLGLASAGLLVRRRAALGKRPASNPLSGAEMSKHRNKYLSLLGGLALATVIGAGLTPGVSLAQSHGQKPQAAKTGLRSGLTPESVTLARHQLAAPKFMKLPLQTTPSLLARAGRLGPHNPDAAIHLTVSLKLRHVSQLKQFLQELSNPASPEYHQFLTPAEFTARYGPTKAAVATVENYLKRRGITVTGVSSNRLLIQAQGKTLAFENTLGVRINNYRLEGRSFFSTEDRPKLPAAVAKVVQAVIGLNNAVQFRSHSHFISVPLPKGSRAAARSAAQALAPPPQTSAYYNPHQIAKAYDWPSITDQDGDGAGVTLAIVTTSSANLDRQAKAWEAFWSAYGLPGHTVNIINVGGATNNTGGLQESVLDIEWSGAMAPGATLNVYTGADASINTLMNLYNRAVSDENPDGSPKNQVMTTSWGSFETGLSEQSLETADAIFMQGASEGISIFAAAGDHGASDGTSALNVADFPSSDPYVTAANGTVLNADINGNYISEAAWSDTGGAISRFFSEPAWQTGPGVPQNGHRNNSDIAMNAGTERPYLMRYGGQWIAGGGTSFVAPELAALFSIGVWQHGGKMLGQSNKLIYDVVNANKTNYANDFRDVTSGCNGKLPDNTPSCAKVNWDHPTGWGSPKASNLLDQLGVEGPFGTLQGTVTDVASGKAIGDAKVVVTPNNLSRITQSDGSYKILLAPGTYTVTVSDFGYKTQTASVTIADGQTTTQNVSLTASPMAKISGNVKDASGHGYGLYAEIKVTTPGVVAPVADVWSDPNDGSYHLSLPEGFDYHFEVAATLNGYDPGTWSISDLSGDQHHDFDLKISDACTAPGYHFIQGFGEDFNGTSLPKGWITEANPSNVAAWKSSGCYFGCPPNWTGGSGSAAFATVPGFIYPPATSFDSQLITPSFPAADVPSGANLTFLVNYQHLKNDALDVGVSSNNGKTWARMAHLVKSYGALNSTPGVKYKINIGDYIPEGAKSIEIRWHYYNKSAAKGHYVQIDDVSIGACQTVAGGLVMGQVTDANTGNGLVGARLTGDQGASLKTIINRADPNLPVGFYMLFAPDGTRKYTVTDYNYSPARAAVEVSPNAVVTQNYTLDAGRLTATPGGINIQAPIDKTTTEALTIANAGSALANFKLREIDLPVSPPAGTPMIRLTGPVPSTAEMARRKASTPTAVFGGPRPRAGTSTVSAPIPLASPAAQTAGAVIATFRPDIPFNGLGVDRDEGDLWLGSQLDFVNKGDNKDHRYLFDGTNTGDSINVASLGANYLADMAFDVNTGKLWQLLGQIERDNTTGGVISWKACIYELDPITRQPTGKKICPVPAFTAVPLGLAYDPVSNTWITSVPGSSGTSTLYQINAKGQILGTKKLFFSIEGLAYNPVTGHLFAQAISGLHTGSSDAVWVLDAGHDFLTKPTHFDIPGYNPLNAGAGLGFDCDNHLWISQETDPTVWEVASGEKGWCEIRHIPWLTVTPALGKLAAGDSLAAKLSIDGKGQKPFTTSQVQLKLQGTTPYGTRTIPVTVHWTPRPADLMLSGNVAPKKLNKGGSLVYTLKVANGQEADHGTATHTTLMAKLPAGVSYVSSGGDGVNCKPASAMAAAPLAAAPSAASAPTALECQLGTLASGASRAVTIAARANEAGTLTGEFKVSSREPNDSRKSTLKLAATVIGDADVGASGEGATLVQGQSGAVHFAVSNAGPDAATDVVLKVSAGSSNVKLQAAASEQGHCAAASNNVFECDLGDVAAGGTVGVTFTTFGIQAGKASVTAKATTSAKDSNNGNNVATAAVIVNAPSNGGESTKGGGGGGFGALALVMLLGLAFSGAALRCSRRS